ncbi:MAG: hypothetical protein IKX26_01130 [Bacteroidales bacterium]|nr:hypothetical protein [Bacteroidales bacterium]
MKFIRLFLIIIFLGSAVSCSKNEENTPIGGVVGNITMLFSVSDKNGNDLLDPEYENNILEGTSLTYNKKIYPVDNTLQKNYDNYINGIPERTDLGSFVGLQLVNRYYVKNCYGYIYAKDHYYLYSGSLESGEERDDDIIINWGDGSKDIVHYHAHFDKKQGFFVRKVYLNDKIYETNSKISLKFDFIK